MAKKYKYYPGNKIGPYKILFLERLEQLSDKQYMGLFECPICKKEFKTRIKSIPTGQMKSCGCIRKQYSNHLLNLIGKRFGKLIVIEDTGKRDPSGHIIWLCQCDCGNFTTASGNNLRKKNVKSCRCLKSQDLIGKKFGKLVVIKDTGKVNIHNMKLIRIPYWDYDKLNENYLMELINE